MTQEIKPKYFRTRAVFRAWLEKNHAKKTELWLLFYKKHTGKACVSYPEAVEEALCFGWIDGKLKSIDGETHMQRFTPRKNGSTWSKVNKERVLNLISSGMMTDAGMLKVEDAMKTGWWAKAYSVSDKLDIPPAFANALKADPIALHNFNSLSASLRNMYVRHYAFAKMDATKENRLAKIIEHLRDNIKPGWWARKEKDDG